MICYGEKQPWTPYFNETYGLEHSLDKNGLRIGMLQGGDKSLLDSNSIGFYEENTLKASFGKTNMSIQEGSFTNLAKIGSLNMQVVDENNIIFY
jgi:hypothetical protein